MPDLIHVELARELSKSYEDRKKIERELKNNTQYKEDLRKHAKELFGRDPRGEDFMKYRLWKEQEGFCLYSGVYVKPETLRDSLATQIDHALPRSRSWDNSWSNKVLCLTDENQHKGNSTPYEYLHPLGRWEGFQSRVKKMPLAKRKKLLVTKFDEDTAKNWKDRNLTDTRYITRLLKNHLSDHLQPPPGDKDKSSKSFVRTRNGALTDHLRHTWGLGQKSRDNHRHHALDAIIVACATESLSQRVANWNRYDRPPGERRPDFEAKAPWPGFRDDVKKAIDKVFVSRMPSRKGKGAIHEDTIKSLRRDGENQPYVVKRVPLTKLSSSNLKGLVDVEIVDGKAEGRNRHLYELLKERLDAHGGKAEKAFAEPLYMPTSAARQGPLIRSVRLVTNDKSGFKVPGRQGIADNGSMVRTDVFKKQGKFFLCPLYVKDLMAGQLPQRLCVTGKPEDQWRLIDDSYDFCFSLYKNDYVVLQNKEGKVTEGYFEGMDRSNASISLRRHDDASSKAKDKGKKRRKEIKRGVQCLAFFQKFSIDYFGVRHEITGEKRVLHLKGIENELAKRPAAE